MRYAELPDVIQRYYTESQRREITKILPHVGASNMESYTVYFLRRKDKWTYDNAWRSRTSPYKAPVSKKAKRRG